jgi:hypothetical protein
LFSGSNSQPNNSSNDSKDGRIRNSVDSRGKADVNIYDDNSYCQFEDTDYKLTDTAATRAGFLLRVTATL